MSFLSCYGIYAYLPYIAAVTGQVLPLFTASFAAFYGMISFSDKDTINSIHFDKDNNFVFNIAISPFVSKDYIVDAR